MQFHVVLLNKTSNIYLPLGGARTFKTMN